MPSPSFRVPAALLAVLLAVSLGCGGAEDGEATAPAAESPSSDAAAETDAPAPESGAIPAAAREEAAQIFATRCFTCHGRSGQGDGPASAGLDPQPRDLTDPAWQESVSDEHIEQIILYGGAAVGRSPAMPANPDLSGRPQVVAALVDHVRSLGDGDAAAETQGGAR